MISVNVLVDHKKWKKSLNKPQLFFDKILRRFPKKYFFSNKKVNFTLLLSNNIAGDLISTFGSFYLIFIGISSFKSESQTSEKSHLMSSSFINGFITNIFNIKAFIFFISLFSIILNDDISSIGKIFIPIYFAVATSLWFSFLTIVLTHENIQKRWEPVQEIINKIAGSILIGLGCLILINILF